MQTENITEFEVGQRLDKTLALLRPEYSRSSIEKLIEDGTITVNNQVVKTKYKLKAGDSIAVNFHELEKEPAGIELLVLYEDENVVVINKPIGVLAHSKGAFNNEGTVASWLRSHTLSPGTVLDDKDLMFWDSNRAGIVHRLDRATSGVMIMAKNKQSQDYLQGQFSKRNVKKTYIAIVSGVLPEPSGIIDIPIERNPKKPATFRAGINGKAAETHFTVLTTHEQRLTNNDSQTYSAVELKPHTGRTHQLRVHLKHLGNPIVGDEFYGGEKAERLFLHAAQLEITIPGSKRMTFTAELPKVFTKYTT